MSLIEDLTNICRLCLNNSEICKSLYENNGDEIVFGLTSINIRDNQNLPTGACNKCWLNVNLAYRIQQDIIANNNKLIEIYKHKLKQDEDEDALHHMKVFSDNFFQIEPEFVDPVNIKEEQDVDDCYIQNNLNYVDFLNDGHCSVCNTKICDSKIEDHIKGHFSQPQKCDECEMQLENAEFHQLHLIKEHGVNNFDVFACSKCSVAFKYKSFYTIHMKKVHPRLNKKDNRNEILAKVKIEENPLKNVINETETPAVDLRCLICNKTCKNRRNLLYHQKNKHQRKRCPICNFEATPDNFSKHVRTHTVKEMICNICGKVLKNDESLRAHIYHTHSTRSYPCPHCDRTFKTNYQRILHIRRGHTGEKNYVCELCGKAFYIENARTEHHKRIHLKQMDFACKFCNRRFSTRSAKKTHERQHTNETPYKCDICGEGFKQNTSLRTHKKSKHKIKEEATETCSICGKKFASKHAIQVHMIRIHQ